MQFAVLYSTRCKSKLGGSHKERPAHFQVRLICSHLQTTKKNGACPTEEEPVQTEDIPGCTSQQHAATSPPSRDGFMVQDVPHGSVTKKRKKHALSDALRTGGRSGRTLVDTTGICKWAVTLSFRLFANTMQGHSRGPTRTTSTSHSSTGAWVLISCQTYHCGHVRDFSNGYIPARSFFVHLRAVSLTAMLCHL